MREYIAVAEYAGDKDFVVEQPDSNDLRKHFSLIERENKMPSEYEINAALRQMGKMSKRDELNCGSCGYNTCREKAIAICQGKAEASMCLPYLQKKAEGFSDRIVNNTPNGIIVLNDAFEVQQINEAAMDIMHIRSASDVLGEQVVRIMDPAVFYEVQKRSLTCTIAGFILRNIKIRRTYRRLRHRQSPLYRHYARHHRRGKEREKKESISKQTIETADKVVDKQMRIVQEIASLLGETAAETKSRLQNSRSP